MDQSVKRKLFFGLVGGLLVAAAIVTSFAAGFGSAYLVGRVPMNSGRWEFLRMGNLGSRGRGEGDEVQVTPAHPLEQEEEFQVFWEAWELVEEHFYGELPSFSDVTYAAIRGMLRTLGDDHTAFLEPSVAAIVEEDATGEFEGIGAFVDMDEEGRFVIVQPFTGGPAETAGLLADDQVLAVDGISTTGKTLYEIISLIRGPDHSQVTLLVRREGIPEPFELVVRRGHIEIPIVDFELRADNIGYVRLSEFSATAAKRVEAATRELLDAGAVGIVLDLRHNPGGWLDQAIDVADLFLDKGVVAIERFSDGTEQQFDSSSGSLAESIPLVVLVDQGSASASEIVAGALQDRERAVLIGEQTFGKGSVQRPFTLSDGSELRVTVARWFTPNDRAINGEGLAPDIEVPGPGSEDSLNEDPQLQRALEYLLGSE